MPLTMAAVLRIHGACSARWYLRYHGACRAVKPCGRSNIVIPGLRLVVSTAALSSRAGGRWFPPAWWWQFPADDAFLPVTLSLPCQVRVYPTCTAHRTAPHAFR
jgi:hypothetical protein